ncbi:aminoacyl-tRNA hydrolase [Clostridium sp. 19966]|uniref:aminoacyl-tRNA hydrolase n=1 Tax=Clostridium sp. 19966 TaxID=2768166 RepID=UPI0028DFF605|nr:aminoacyl-tRNA hydrolase [Clostridium sp. 19966]MDT8715739.1 aminoacyl-tRNA hydrolase [Clostridium sp. 19966]
MYLVVGLGNPGSEYAKTKHNVGFDVVDLLADKYNIDINRKKFKGVFGEGNICGKKVILLKPHTYMNLSGESVGEAVKFYKIDIDNIIIVYDDMSLDIGRIRIREKGSAGGHNGIKNIIAMLSTDAFPRIKVGVGKPKGSWVSHVLSGFDKNERIKLEKTFDMVVESIETIVNSSVSEAMNKFNGITIE